MIEQRCGWCTKSTGTTSKAFVFCWVKQEMVARETTCDIDKWMRAPGSDDDKGEEND